MQGIASTAGSRFRPFLSVALVLSLVWGMDVAAAPALETVIQEPASVIQYDDAIVVYLHGFDVARKRYPALNLRYRLILADGTVGEVRTLDLTQPWEKPAIILRKGGIEYSGIVVEVSSGSNVFFRRLYHFTGTTTSTPLLPTLAQAAAIEAGQHMVQAPTIPLPDLSLLDSVTIGAASRTADLDANTFQVQSSINYPLVSSSHTCALSRQTDHPLDDSKRSVYIPLKSQLYDPATGQPTKVLHYLCEVPLDTNWLNGTEDLLINLEANAIKVHWSDQEFEGGNILGSGAGGLGQTTGTMARDANGNIYFSRVPSQIVRFNIARAEFEIPPVRMKTLMDADRPTQDEIDSNGSANKKGNWGSYRMIWEMNNTSPRRMVFASVQNRLLTTGYFWAGMWTLPQDHWDDPAAFTNAWRFHVGAWPTAAHTFWDTLPVLNGPNHRLLSFTAYGNTVYVKPYPNSVGGPWRLDLDANGNVELFGAEATLTNYHDGLSKPRSANPYNAGGMIGFQDYGVLTMTRSGLHKALTGLTDNSRTGELEVNYDAIEHMLQSPAQFALILQNIGGPSLAPTYMATHIPGRDGQVLGAAEYGYYLANFDMNTTNKVDKEYLTLESADPNLALPLKAGLGPYGHQWVDLDGDDWLYLGGYIGLTRFKYASNGIPLLRQSMSKFDTQLSHLHLDDAGAGAIKRFRYLQHGLDGRMFLTGTHTPERAGTAFSGGLLSFHRTHLDTLWRLSYLSRGYNTTRLQNRIVRETDGTPVQEFALTGSYVPGYEPSLSTEQIPTNQDAKVFFFDYPAGGQMRDRLGFSLAPKDGTVPDANIAYSPDRRYLLVLQNDCLLSFDPQTLGFIDGKRLTFGNEIFISLFRRPDTKFLRAPDDRLFLYVTENESSSTSATFVEILVSPAGELTFAPYLALRSTNAANLGETYRVVHAFLPDYANNDGSYDLFFGQPIGSSDTDCRLIEDFVPPRRHALTRTVNVLSRGAGDAVITGAKPGTTPYSATCADGQNITLTASSPAAYVFKEWRDEDGNTLGAGSTLNLAMTVDRIVTAVFGPATPTPTNLAVSEIHYHPAAPTGSEIAAGYSMRDAFEFIELMNTGAKTLDLNQVSFVEGIGFDFSTNQFNSLAPGKRVVLVSDRGAFIHRYGANLLAHVAGEYTGDLSDQGEMLTLRNGTNVIHAFAYDDQSPWPNAMGGSLVLIHPTRQPPPDHSEPFNWRASMAGGGTPGTYHAPGYAAWKTGYGISLQTPESDSDQDGRLNVVEYLQNTDPGTADSMNGMSAAIETLQVGGVSDPYFVIRVLRRLDADDLELTIEFSDDLKTWTSNQTVFLGRQRSSGSLVEWLIFRSAAPARGDSRKYAWLRVRVR